MAMLVSFNIKSQWCARWLCTKIRTYLYTIIKCLPYNEVVLADVKHGTT